MSTQRPSEPRGTVSVRVVIVTNIPTPYRTAFYGALSDSLAKKNSTLSVLYCAESEPGRNWHEPLRHAHFDYAFLRGVNVRLKEANLHLNARVGRALASRNPDVVIIGGYARPTSQIARVWCRRRSIPHVLWFESNLQSGRYRGTWLQPVRRRLLAGFDRYLVPGRPAELALETWLGERPQATVLVPNTIDELALQRALTVQAPLPAPRDPMRQRWICVGQLIERKGIQIAIRALEGIPNVTLDIIGDGPLRPELESIARSVQVSAGFLGHQQPREVLRRLASADVAIIPSLRDPSPLVAVEAIATGRPVLVSSHVGNVDDVVEDGENGYRFDPTDEASTAAAFRRMAACDSHQRRRMGAHSRALFERRFQTAHVAERLADELLRIAVG